MGDSPEESVVDRDLKAHHPDNLHVVGSSVFPAPGTSSPTLTASALRLGGHPVSLRASGRARA